MFRDREEALQELQKKLLEEEEEAQYDEEEYDDEEACDEEYEDEYDEDYDDEAPDAPEFAAYNADRSDTDLEEFSDDVYQAAGKKSGCALWMILSTTALLLLLSYLLAKFGGML